MSEVSYWHHMARLFMALFVSGPADMSYQEFRADKRARMRRFAICARARAAVQFDRMLCGEEERALHGR